MKKSESSLIRVNESFINVVTLINEISTLSIDLYGYQAHGFRWPILLYVLDEIH